MVKNHFSGLSAVETIGSYFLFGCTGLTTINFSGLSAVTKIGSDFLRRCTGLRTLDLSGLSAVRNIGAGFLAQCTLPSNKAKVTVKLSGSSDVVFERVLSGLDGTDVVEMGETHQPEQFCPLTC